MPNLPMNASKENCRAALSHLRSVMLIRNIPNDASLEFITNFLEAAERKLPSEESFTRERVKKNPAVSNEEKLPPSSY